MKEHIIGITVALPQEARALFGTLGWSRSEPFPARVERFQDLVAMVVITGQGMGRAKDATRFLLESHPLLIMNLGVAGALVDGLDSGDLIIPDALTNQECKVELESPAKRAMDVLMASTGIRFRRGLLVSTDETVDSPGAKQALHKATGASAVDMEAFAVARTCKDAGIPCYVVKAITDSLSQAIPRAITDCLSETGHISFTRFTMTILSRPWLIPTLVEMQKSFKSAIFSLEQIKVLLAANLSRSSLS